MYVCTLHSLTLGLSSWITERRRRREGEPSGEREDGTKNIDDISIDDENDPRSIPGVTKERLAAKPIKYVLNGTQRYLSIWYDLAADHLTIKHEGVDAVKLPPPTKSL